jgi:hypothetical protein
MMFAFTFAMLVLLVTGDVTSEYPPLALVPKINFATQWLTRAVVLLAALVFIQKHILFKYAFFGALIL